MKKTSTLDKKIGRYAALTGGAIAAVGAADAQIIYTDINPDLTVSGHQQGFQLDLNNDAAVDFTIFILDSSASGTYMSIPYTAYYGVVGAFEDASGNEISLDASGNAAALNSGFNIDGLNSWGSAGSTGYIPLAYNIDILFMGQTINTNGGEWLGQNDKYLGLRFFAGPNIHYGWARLSVNNDANEFTIKDYAYNSTPNQPLQAGQTVVSVDENILTDVKVWEYNRQLFLDTYGNYNNGIINVTNMMGQVVKSFNFNNAYNVVDLGDLATGAYVVTVTSEGKVLNQKIAVK
ncbi:MAG: T9SS type A sorting domain-containing protein [Flavobacteriales bacterium]